MERIYTKERVSMKKKMWNLKKAQCLVRHQDTSIVIIIQSEIIVKGKMMQLNFSKIQVI